MTRIFLRDDDGRRPVYGDIEKFQTDPHWRDLVLFHEYFHGDNGAGIGASHQTGWTGLVAKLLQQSGERMEVRAATPELESVSCRDPAAIRRRYTRGQTIGELSW